MRLSRWCLKYVVAASSTTVPKSYSEPNPGRRKSGHKPPTQTHQQLTGNSSGPHALLEGVQGPNSRRLPLGMRRSFGPFPFLTQEPICQPKPNSRPTVPTPSFLPDPPPPPAKPRPAATRWRVVRQTSSSRTRSFSVRSSAPKRRAQGLRSSRPTSGSIRRFRVTRRSDPAFSSVPASAR